MTLLSVNVNKIALIRNSRGTDFPNLIRFTEKIIAAGVHGITVHPRPDQRHITYQDTHDLKQLLAEHPELEYNIEGNPVPAFMDIIDAVRPHQCTLVPDAEDQLTSDHGWQIAPHLERLQGVCQQLRAWGVRSSLFMDPDTDAIAQVPATGADRIELYTESYARAYACERQAQVLAQYEAAAREAERCGLGVNAGHDLNQHNLALFLTLPNILEVSIGHAIVVESLEAGLASTLQRYLAITGH